MPSVSVIIPTYNRREFLRDAVDSVLRQTFQDLEVIVVDDGSTDGTAEAVQDRYGNRVRYIRQPNQGRSVARNTGVGTAQGQYIAFLDSDDVWKPEKLERQLTWLDAHPEAGLAQTFSDVIRADGTPDTVETRRRRRLYAGALRRGYSYLAMSRQCIMFLSTVMVRVGCIHQIGPMDSSTEAFEDWDWYLRASRVTTITTLPEPLVLYRLHGTNSTSAEFSQGRTRLALKHLAWLEEHGDFAHAEHARRNFLIHLAAVAYQAGEGQRCAAWIREALRVDPTLVLQPGLLRYTLCLCIPERALTLARAFRRRLERRVL